MHVLAFFCVLRAVTVMESYVVCNCNLAQKHALKLYVYIKSLSDVAMLALSNRHRVLGQRKL